MKLICRIFILTVFSLCSFTARAEPFKGGRDIAMMSIGALNVSLLVMVIWKAAQKDPASEKPLDKPQANVQLQSERDVFFDSLLQKK